MPIHTNIISATELAALMPDCVILDCRARLGEPDWGTMAFKDGHIAGAIYADLDRDLAAPPGSQGRHPLPEPDQWLQCVRGWGIEPGLQVVAYDDAGGAYAARAWWMLRWLGHAAVAVLDGGLQTWSQPLQTGAASATTASTYEAGPALTRTISSDLLLQAVNSDTPPPLIDARTRARWAGDEEPIDPVAGHIPGAVCLPFQDNLDTRGCFKSVSELRARFDGITASQDDAQMICYCGSGVTATHNILAMHIARLPEATLYADSWSGWITDPARPVATAG